jgi:hypothetical protein
LKDQEKRFSRATTAVLPKKNQELISEEEEEFKQMIDNPKLSPRINRTISLQTGVEHFNLYTLPGYALSFAILLQ